MTRIAVLTTSFPRYEGDEASVFVQRLVEGFSDQGASGVVIVPRDAEEPARGTCRSFRIHRFRYGIFCRGGLAFGAGVMPNIRRRPLLILQAPALLVQLCAQAIRHRNEYEVVHANWALALLAAWIVKLFCKKPYVVTVRGEDLKLLKAFGVRALFRRALRSALAVVSVNQNFADELRALNLGTSEPLVIPNGVTQFSHALDDATAYLQTRPFWPRQYFLFVGTIIPRKRVADLVSLLTLPQFLEHALVLCGRLQDQSYVETVMQRARDLKVEERVFFEGPVSPDRVGIYLSAAALYVSASQFEGRPNAVLEAMAAGAPCLLSDIPAHREIVQSGTSGLLCDFEQPQSLGAVLSSHTQADLERMARRAQEQLKGQTWSACAQSYLNIFSGLV